MRGALIAAFLFAFASASSAMTEDEPRVFIKHSYQRGDCLVFRGTYDVSMNSADDSSLRAETKSEIETGFYILDRKPGGVFRVLGLQREKEHGFGYFLIPQGLNLFIGYLNRDGHWEHDNLPGAATVFYLSAMLFTDFVFPESAQKKGDKWNVPLVSFMASLTNRDRMACTVESIEGIGEKQIAVIGADLGGLEQVVPDDMGTLEPTRLLPGSGIKIRFNTGRKHPQAIEVKFTSKFRRQNANCIASVRMAMDLAEKTGDTRDETVNACFAREIETCLDLCMEKNREQAHSRLAKMASECRDRNWAALAEAIDARVKAELDAAKGKK